MFELFDPSAEVRVTGGANLPHWFQSAATYFITFRTEDSIPVDIARRWHAERDAWLSRHGISRNSRQWREKVSNLPRTKRDEYHGRFSHRYMDSLDSGWGACILQRSELSNIVADSLLYFDGVRYHMGDFVVMPNHVHLLVCLRGQTDVVKQCCSWKRFTARRINEVLGTSGRFWQEESFDHLVRSPAQFHRIQKYIRDNPRNLRTGQYFLYQALH